MKTCFVFDLDGTISRTELLPAIAQSLNLEREITLLTQLTLSGAIPFEDSFTLRFAILKAARISEVRRSIEKIELDENLLNFIQQRRNNSYIITGNLDLWIEPLIARVGCEAFTSRGKREGDRVTELVEVLHKGDPVLGLRQTYDRIVAIGDSANDIPMFDAADIGIAFGGIHNPAATLTEVSDYVVFDSGSLCQLLITLS